MGRNIKKAKRIFLPKTDNFLSFCVWLLAARPRFEPGFDSALDEKSTGESFSQISRFRLWPFPASPLALTGWWWSSAGGDAFDSREGHDG